MDADLRGAVPDWRSAEIAGISRQRLRYWARTDLVKPDVERVISPRNVVRLYSLPRVIELVVASQLRHEGVSLQHIRRIVEYLRRQGYEAPLREVRFARSGDQVLFQHADGSWEESRHPYQGVIIHVINVEEIRTRIRDHLRRSSADEGVIEKHRKVQASKPVFRGTRVPVAVVRGYLEAGKSHAEIIEAFPSLTEHDIEAVEAQLTSTA